MEKNPWRHLMLLKQRRDIGIDDDIARPESGQRRVPADPQIGQKRFQLRI